MAANRHVLFDAEARRGAGFLQFEGDHGMPRSTAAIGPCRPALQSTLERLRGFLPLQKPRMNRPDNREVYFRGGANG